KLDRWLAEGTANALAAHWLERVAVEGGLDTFDPETEDRFRAWLQEPWVSAFDTVVFEECAVCYDSFLWWSRTFALNPGAIQGALMRIAREGRGRRSVAPARQLAALELEFDR